MDGRLTKLMQKLGNAINGSVLESESIVEAVGEIRKAGYDVFIVLKATFVINKRKEGQEEQEIDIDSSKKTGLAKTGQSSPIFKITKQDKDLLGEMHISLGDNGDEKNGSDEKGKKKKKK